MPLHIIKGNITQVQCDAIVNATNTTLFVDGGVDEAIHREAGPQLLEACKTLGFCKTGEAKITKGYNLPCKYVIHTVGPIWEGGKHGEKELLRSCYKNSLALAKENNCETVAFPLISSGCFGYPKEEVLSVAVTTISKFLLNNDMTVYIVVFDKSSYQIDRRLYGSVQAYIMKEHSAFRRPRMYSSMKSFSAPIDCCYMEDACCYKAAPSLVDMLSDMDDTFAVTLLKLIDMKGMSEVECYKKANVSKQTWYKIMNEKDYKPSKNTVIAFSIALQLTLEETKKLLGTVGFALSKSSKFDIIIEYFLIREVYDIFVINETLFKFDQVCLGV